MPFLPSSKLSEMNWGNLLRTALSTAEFPNPAGLRLVGACIIYVTKGRPSVKAAFSVLRISR